MVDKHALAVPQAGLGCSSGGVIDEGMPFLSGQALP